MTPELGMEEFAAAIRPALPSRRCMPVEEWPELDRTRWIAALKPGDPFTAAGIAAEWAPTSQREIANGYGRWLTWLAHYSYLDRLSSPGTRVTEERVRAYISDLKKMVAPHTVVTRLLQLQQALRALEPRIDSRWVMRAACRLRGSAKSVQNKRARIQTPDRIATLGEGFMAEIMNGGAVSRHTAKNFRNGLIIAFLAQRPVRAANLTAITMGQHLAKRGDAWWLSFAPGETKNRRPLDIPLPTSLVPYLEKYLSEVRPFLLSRGGRSRPARTNAIWISRNATPMAFTTISYCVKRVTAAAFGAPINLHLFRDCVATTIAIANPENVGIITDILGHATPTTGEKFYNQAEGNEAGRRYHEVLAVLRDRCGTRPGGRHTGGNV
jgi:integrase/recombinase XerD